MAKKLKDVNKDGKVNFKDTWLGERLSTKGKLKGPNLAESLKGARRVSDTPATESKPAPKAASKPASAPAPKPKPRPASLDATSGASRSVEGKVKAKAAVGGRGDGAAEVERRRKDRLAKEAQRTALKSVGDMSVAEASRKQAPITQDTARPSFDVSYDQWLKMTPAKRKELGLPATYGAIQRLLGTKMKTQTKNRFKFYNRED